MVAKTIKEILDAFEAIQPELARTSRPPLDLAQINNVSLLILDLAEDIAVYLESERLLDLWAKDNLANALGMLEISWQFAAMNHLSLIFWDRSRLSSNITYKKEIINLNFDTLMEKITLLKARLQGGGG